MAEATGNDGEGARLPEEGLTRGALLEALEASRNGDIDWRDGRAAAPVYFIGDEVLDVQKDAFTRYFCENPLYVQAFPGLTRLESEVASITADLLHAPGGRGNITSGGTESIFLAVKAARDRARAERHDVTEPTIVAPFTAHPAFNKSAHYLGLRVIRTPLDGDSHVDLAAYRAAVTKDTVLMVGSAPDYPFGQVDPIPEMAAIAAERGINFHTDACLGGFFLPFAEQLGHAIPPWDFRVPGVSSISADLHKYGYAARGASTITWRDESLYRYQPFEFDEWPSGLYATPTFSGTKPPGAIAAAWSVMHFLGAKGYRQAVDRNMRLARRLIEGIRGMPDLEVIGDPAICIFSYTSRTLDIGAVATGLEDRGWSVTRGKTPLAIHVMIFNALAQPSADPYLSDLEDVLEQVRAGKIVAREREARYG